MQLNIGATRPVDGDRVYDITRLEDRNKPESFVVLIEGRRIRKRNIKGCTAESVVEQFPDGEFARFNLIQGGVAWIRKSFVREVHPFFDPDASDRYKRGSMVFMTFSPPYRGFPPGKSYMEGASFLHSWAPEEVRRRLGLDP